MIPHDLLFVNGTTNFLGDQSGLADNNIPSPRNTSSFSASRKVSGSTIVKSEYTDQITSLGNGVDSIGLNNAVSIVKVTCCLSCTTLHYLLYTSSNLYLLFSPKRPPLHIRYPRWSSRRLLYRGDDVYCIYWAILEYSPADLFSSWHVAVYF